MRRKWIGASAIAITASLALAGPSVAESASADSPHAVDEVVVTAAKRTENLQSVPQQLEVLGSRQIEQLHISNFQDYQKFLPSLSYQTLGPNQTSVYMRGVSSGDNANHSGPLPTVGVYLDELPITTIGGTIDVNMYDTARVEVLPGPQGTLYGASSEAGTMRIITNKPSTAHFEAGYKVEGDLTRGDTGYNLDGFVNLPVNDQVAVRLVAWAERTPGYIDNVYGERTFATSGFTINNRSFVKKNANTSDNIGGRAAVLWTPDPNWTVTANVIGQDQHIDGVYGFLPAVGDLEVQRFGPDKDHDSWFQTGLTVTGKIGDFELTYAGGYFKRKIFQRQDYADYSIFYDGVYGSGANWLSTTGNPLTAPQQNNINDYHYNKYSNEVRIASPQSARLRVIAGLFQERQQHHIIQNQNFLDQGYQYGAPAEQFATDLAPAGWPGTLWLTNQRRVDRDYAAFGEATFDVTDHLSLLLGIRGYHYKNTLYGFFGYSQGYNQLSGFSAGEGADRENCIAGKTFPNTPCVNLDKASKGSGETHKVTLTYKFNRDNLVYATYSTGYRPGGINRNGDFGAYSSDKLSNYELGLKTSLLDNTLTWNSAIYLEKWNQFQFSFLGPNDLTIIENAPKATIKGIETSVNWNLTQQFSLNAGAAYTHARLTKNFCGTDQDTGLLIETCADADAVAVSGAHLPYTPDFKGYAAGRYTFSWRDWDAFGQASVTYQTRSHVGLRTADDEALGTMPAYATVDLSTGASRDGLSLQFIVKNLFDSRGQENRYTTCPVQLCSSDLPGVPHSVYVAPIIPRTFALQLEQKF